MLDDLRKNQKGIIWLIAIIFIAGMAVMGIVEIFHPKPFVGRIYGNKILYTEFEKMLREAQDNYRMQSQDRTIDEQTMRSINEQVWNQLVSRTIFDRQFKRNRIKVKDAEVIERMLNNPPDDVRQIFQIDGIFSQERYLETIVNNPDFRWRLEQYIRETLPREKLERKIKDQVVVTEDSVRVDWLSKNERASGRVISFDWNRIDEQDVTDAEIQAYYNKNSKNYRQEAVRRYRYAHLPLTPTREDTLRAYDEIHYIHNLVMQGGDFAELAEAYSQDPGSAAEGGSLGFFGRGRMVPEFEEVAFNMEIGQISEPFLSSFGYHFMKVTDKRITDGEEEVEASHILIKPEISDATRFALRNTAEDLYELARKVGLEIAAAEMGIETRETSDITEDSEFIPGMGRYPHLVKLAFKNRVGKLIEPFSSQDGSYYVAEVSHRQPAQIQPLDQLTEVIRREVDKEKRMKIARQKADDMLRTFEPEEWFAQADSLGFRVLDFNNILITRNISGIGLVKPLNRAIFNTEAGEWTDIVQTEDGIYKAQVTSRNTPSMDIFERDIERLTNDYRKAKEDTHWNEWYQKVLKDAKVEDLRYIYYQ